MINLKTSYLGLELKNPVIVGSSRLTGEMGTLTQCVEKGASAVVIKSLFEEQIIKEAESRLDKELLIKYNALNEDEVKSLVVNDKWLSHLRNSVQGEMERISQKLAGRIKELAERYSMPLPELTKEVEDLSKNVEGHLKNMGFKW